MIPDDCKRIECLFYADEGHIRCCNHPEYDDEKEECPGWVSLADARVHFGDNDKEREE